MQPLVGHLPFSLQVKVGFVEYLLHRAKSLGVVCASQQTLRRNGWVGSVDALHVYLWQRALFSLRFDGRSVTLREAKLHCLGARMFRTSSIERGPFRAWLKLLGPPLKMKRSSWKGPFGAPFGLHVL